MAAAVKVPVLPKLLHAAPGARRFLNCKGTPARSRKTA